MNALQTLLNQTVNRLFILVWPPYGEDQFLDVDISIGFIFAERPDRLCVVSTDMSDMWTPLIRYEAIPNKIHAWSSFDSRIKHWMNSLGHADFDDEYYFDTEYYEVTNVDLFENIVSQVIQSVEFVAIKNIAEPFGVKVNFENNFILSTPIADGNTIETSRFNTLNNHLVFEYFGTIEYRIPEH